MPLYILLQNFVHLVRTSACRTLSQLIDDALDFPVISVWFMIQASKKSRITKLCLMKMSFVSFLCFIFKCDISEYKGNVTKEICKKIHF